MKTLLCPTCVNCGNSKPLYYLTAFCAFSFVVDLSSTFIALTVWPEIFSEKNVFFACVLKECSVFDAFMLAGVCKLLFLYFIYYSIFPKLFKYLSILGLLGWSVYACWNNIYLMITVT